MLGTRIARSLRLFEGANEILDNVGATRPCGSDPQQINTSLVEDRLSEVVQLLRRRLWHGCNDAGKRGRLRTHHFEGACKVPDLVGSGDEDECGDVPFTHRA